MNQNKSEVQLKTLNQLEDLVKSRLGKLGPIMDDYDGGQTAAYESVINDINAFRAIIKHTSS
jgi:hypothetical protein